MKKLTAGLLISSLIFLGGCIKFEKADKSEPVIKVNGQVITENMFKETLEQNYNVPDQKDSDLKDPKNKFIYLVHKNRVINELIIRELINEEAKKRHINVKEDEVDEVVNDIAKSMGGPERFKSSLALNKIDEKVFRKNIKLDLIKKKLVENIVGDSKISDEEITKFYEENKEEKFKRDAQVRASHILISASESEIRSQIEDKNKDLKKEEIDKKVKEEVDKARARAQKVLNDAKKNPDNFGELAKLYSEDPSCASKGGDLGFFSKEEMVPEFSEAAFTTKPGEISGLVKTVFGYHIIKVTDRKQEGVTPLDEIKPHIERYLDGRKKMEAFKQLITSSKESAKIEYVKEEYDPENIQAEYRKLIQELQKSEKTEPVSSKEKEPKESPKK